MKFSTRLKFSRCFDYFIWLAIAGAFAAMLTPASQAGSLSKTSPSAYSTYDEDGYFPAGHEFPLQNEADYLNAQKALATAGAKTKARSEAISKNVSGQTLPSPYYIEEGVQYFPAGHEFPLQNEADYLDAEVVESSQADAAHEGGPKLVPPARN